MITFRNAECFSTSVPRIVNALIHTLAPAIESPPAFSVRDVLMRTIETDEDGILFVEHADSTARICLHGGRIAWVHSGERGGFLSARLGKLLGLSAQQLHATLLECRDKRRPLGEHLVAQGMLTQWKFREVLAAHSRDHLHALLSREQAGGPAEFSFEVRADRYNPAFTFTPEALLGAEHRDVGTPEAQSVVDSLEGVACVRNTWLMQWGVVVASTTLTSPPAPLSAMLSWWHASGGSSGNSEMMAHMGASSLVVLTAASQVALILRCESRRAAQALKLARALRPRLTALTHHVDLD